MNHKVLLSKLEHDEIIGTPFKFLQNCLMNKLPYDHRRVKRISSHFVIFSYIVFWKFTMVLTRAQMDNLSREEL